MTMIFESWRLKSNLSQTNDISLADVICLAIRSTYRFVWHIISNLLFIFQLQYALYFLTALP